MQGTTSRLVILVILFALPPGVAAGHEPPSIETAAAADASEPCPDDPYYGEDAAPIEPDRVITGKFRSEREGSYVFLPVRVPPHQTALRVKYCFDQPENVPEGSPESHTLDLGLYEPRADTSRPWGISEFRGWGGSSHRDVTLSTQGYSSERRYVSRDWVPGRTTRAFEPGSIPAGRWAVELGLASIVSRERGDADGRVAYRVELDWSAKPSFAEDPYEPAPYDGRPATRRPGWYAGDFHVHGEHSALGDAPMSEVFEYAFGSLAQGKAGLDFITLSDYVSGASWDEVGRYQEDYPDSLIIRSAEVITYRGHANSHANTGIVDYRTGPLYVRRSEGGLKRLRGPRPASAIFDRIHRAGGFTQINHPTIFPSAVPFFASLCRGCPWDYGDRQTDYSSVDAIEIATGPPGLEEVPGEPGPNPFTVTAIEFWEDALADGHKIAAVGSSDSHNAGETPDPVTQAPIGTATTVVRAPELSHEGIEGGVRAGHTYVKVYGNDGPDLRFQAVPAGGASTRAAAAAAPARRAIMGDTLRAERATFTARVLGGAPGSIEGRPDPLELLVFKDGLPFRAAPVTSDDFKLTFRSAGPGRYRLQVQRQTAIEAVSSPIYLEPAARDGDGDRRSPRDGDRRGGGSREGDDGGRGDGGDGRQDAAASDSRTAAASGGAGATGVGSGLPFTGLQLAVLALAGAALAAGGAAAHRHLR